MLQFASVPLLGAWTPSTSASAITQVSVLASRYMRIGVEVMQVSDMSEVVGCCSGDMLAVSEKLR